MTAEIVQPADTLVEPRPPGLTRAGVVRLDAIDMLRGLVIVLMVLDHVRDYFHIDAFVFDPTDPARTTPLLFATRWVTHLCAVTFVFLAGVSIHFQRANGKPIGELSVFLLKRGAWLILLEATMISFGFNFGWPFLFVQVIWAIGAGMIAMSVLIRLPERVLLVLGVALIVLTPVLMMLTAGASGPLAVLRTLFIAPGLLGAIGFVPYPAIPWLGIMLLGAGLGPIFRGDPVRRGRGVLMLAVVLIAGFAVLRALNLGDPARWSMFAEPHRTVMAFLNLSKYPPSPDFVMATLGVSLLLFLALKRLRGLPARALLAFGRTPLFTYLCHIYIAHGLMLVMALATGFDAAVAQNFISANASRQAGWGYSLPAVYVVWALVIVALYPLARWFEGVKRRRRDWWLSYI